MRHVISIHDVVSDTMHQFAPTYHNYVLYSNGGSKEAPKTVGATIPHKIKVNIHCRAQKTVICMHAQGSCASDVPKELLFWGQVKAKTFVAVGHETANKGEGGKNLRRDTMDANLLANMELGVHSDAAPGRHTSDMVTSHPCQALSRTCLSAENLLLLAHQSTVPVSWILLHPCCGKMGGLLTCGGRIFAGYYNRRWHPPPYLMALVLQDGSVNGVAHTTTEDDAFYRTTRDPLEVDEEGIEMSSAPVTYGDLDKKGKGIVRKVDSEDAEAPGESPIPTIPLPSLSITFCLQDQIRQNACLDSPVLPVG